MPQLTLSSVCIVDATGKVVKDSNVDIHPEALVKFFKDFGLPLALIGLESGPLSQWLHAGLVKAGFETLLMETRHVKKALSASNIKTDRRDARGMAQLLRMGWFRPLHAKSVGSQEVRTLLVARKQLQRKLTDIELSIRGILRGFGLMIGVVTKKGVEARIRGLVTGHAMLEQIAKAMLTARSTLLTEFNKLHKAVFDIARRDEVCRRFMTTPSVGAIVAITYKSALDDPSRIKKSKNAGPLSCKPTMVLTGTDVIHCLYTAARAFTSRWHCLRRNGAQATDQFRRSGTDLPNGCGDACAGTRKAAVRKMAHYQWFNHPQFGGVGSQVSEVAEDVRSFIDPRKWRRREREDYGNCRRSEEIREGVDSRVQCCGVWCVLLNDGFGVGNYMSSGKMCGGFWPAMYLMFAFASILTRSWWNTANSSPLELVALPPIFRSAP
jgi:transposase